MTPHDDDQLEAQLRQAFQGRAATTTIDEPPGIGVRTLRAQPAGKRPDSRRILAAAAAVVALVGGLLTASRLATDRHDTTDATVPGQPTKQPTQHECGDELPFEFPAPDGFAGPLPGLSDGSPVAADQGSQSADDLVFHYTAPGRTIDVTWPMAPPLDASTPTDGLSPFAQSPRPEPVGDGRSVVAAEFASSALGDGACFGLGVTVTATDQAALAQTVDHIALGLSGPGGPLAITSADLVATSAAAEALPSDVVACSGAGGDIPATVTLPPNPGEGPLPTPEAALLAYTATASRGSLYGWHWDKLTLPDGSVGFVQRQNGPTSPVTIVLHVVHHADGWAVESGKASGC